MDKKWMMIKLIFAGLMTSAPQSNDFFTEFNVNNNQSYWLNVARESVQVSSNLCINKQKILVLFATNAEHQIVSRYLTDIFKSQNITQADVWINFTVTHDPVNNQYTHSWGQEVFENVWAPRKPDTNCVKYPDFCCARMSWENQVYVGLKDSSCFTAYNFLCAKEQFCPRLNCSHGCQENSTHHTCTCRDGYTLATDGRSCVDVDLCNDALCKETRSAGNGSVTCGCKDGYELQSDGYTCRDIDECRYNWSFCDQRCANTEGSFTCTCSDGYRIHDINKTCVDVNECENSSHSGCSQNCTNTPGSYRCECYLGYSLTSDDITCVDIDECVSSPCQNNCTNTPGSYHCKCPSGHTLSSHGTACLDIDECQDTSKCPGACTNTVGSYFCGCYHGYQDINKRCVDVDECVDGQHNCSQTCHNFDGGYNCSCHLGYTTPADNRFECHDINECHDDNLTCQHNCINTDGSYYCTCNKGYDLDSNNRSCHDIDECQLNKTICGHFCNNTQGSFYCSCPPGLSVDQDGRSCVMVHRKCTCLCSRYACNDGTCLRGVAAMEEFRKELLLDVRNLSAYVRSKTSAGDTRTTARALGHTGLGILVGLAVLLVLLDMSSIICYMFTAIHRKHLVGHK